MDFGDLKIDDLTFGATLSFGPTDSQPDFGQQFDGRLFKPYNKREKLGKMVEFSMAQSAVQPTQNSVMLSQQNAMKQTGAQKQQVQTNANSQLVESAEDFGFTNVEDKSKAKQEKKRNNVTQQSQAQKAKAKVQQEENKAYLINNFSGPQQTKKKQQWAAQVARANNQNQPQTQVNTSWQRRGIREPSFEVKSEWEVIQEFSKQRFDKLPNLIPGVTGTETSAGQIHAFDSAWDRVRMQKSKKLPQFKGTVPNEITTRDPIIQRLAQEGKAQIFATDLAAAALMTSSKAQYPWDLIIKKWQGFLFIDKRDEENMLDWQTVSETAQVEFQPLDEEGINGVRQLIKEAARTSNDYLSALQSKTFKSLKEEDPFVEDEDQVICHMGYYYNIWKLDKDLKICIRCTVHSYLEMSGESLNCYVLPEWSDKRQNWSKELDNQTAVSLTKEIADNSTKFCRWTVQSILSGVEKMRFAFVQRADSQGLTHKAVGSFTTETQGFAQQINLNIENCWATLKDVVDTVYQREETAGEFLYLKDLSQQPNYRLIKIVEQEDEESDDNQDGNQDDGL